MSDSFWSAKRVLVTGGAGFVGSHLVEKIVKKGSRVTILDTLENGSEKNLVSVRDAVRLVVGSASNASEALAACKDQDIVMNLAARVGGIEYNRTHQATMMRDNLLIATIMLEAARQAQVEQFLTVSSACVYPQESSIPTPETEGFLGEPEVTNRGYGWAKRMAERLAQYYSEEFGMNVAIVRPYNTYGPRDHFNPQVSHVIPALIRRIFKKENPLTVWGSGKQTRSFIYVEDLADGMIRAIEARPTPEAINLGSDEEVSIAALVEIILELSGEQVDVHFDTSKPDGSPRRNSDNSLAKERLGFSATTPLRDGLLRTIEWYREYGA